MIHISHRGWVVFHDIIMIAVAWELSWMTRYNFNMPMNDFWVSVYALPFVLVIQGVIVSRFGLYKGIWRFASLPDLMNIIRATLLGTVCITIALFVYNRLNGVPRSMLILYPLMLMSLLGGPRLIYRFWKDHRLSLKSMSADSRLLVIGAGQAGEGLVRDMLRMGNFQPVGFIDDKQKLQGRHIQGVPVLGTTNEIPEVVKDYDPDLVVIAIPSAGNQTMQRIVNLCEETNVRFRTLPKSRELVSGASYISELREVLIEDLLSRDKVELDWKFINQNLVGKTVMITGGGGSIGSELCRQVASLGPSQLIILEHSEYNLYQIEQELILANPALKLNPVLGSVCDRETVDSVIANHRPDVIFHAAAYKHVPLLQDQVRIAVRNNIYGTRVVAEAASRHGVSRFVLISTDKAVNPTSVMGMSKRIAEMVCEHINSTSQTRYITVRFGNVLGSAGSVVPLFKKQIAKGGPVTVTHPEMTRYFMTIPEASQLILQAAAMGEGGEIFILEMGEPVKITFLAEQMIRLMGKHPGEDIEIRYTGLRPGEKLFEELFHNKETMASTKYEKILLAKHRELDADLFEQLIANLLAACDNFDDALMNENMKSLVPESLLSDSTDKSDNVVSIQ